MDKDQQLCNRPLDIELKDGIYTQAYITHIFF